jgi:uncharacterized protein YkwD
MFVITSHQNHTEHTNQNLGGDMFHVKRWLIGLCVSGFALACPGEPAPKPIENHIKEWLQAHNRARAAKGVRPLSWNPDLEKHARQWATKLC